MGSWAVGLLARSGTSRHVCPDELGGVLELAHAPSSTHVCWLTDLVGLCYSAERAPSR